MHLMGPTELIQQSQQKTGQSLKQQELNYYAYEDMMNVLSIATQLDEFEKYLANHPELRNQAEQLLLIQRNRLICQINLSNTIHADLKFTAQSDGLENDLKSAKLGCHIFAQNYSKTFESSVVQEYLKYYFTNNLAEGNCLHQINLNETKGKNNFDQQTVQKVFDGMNKQDNTVADIKKYGYTPPTEGKMQQRLQQTRQETQKNVVKIDFNQINWDPEEENTSWCCCILI